MSATIEFQMFARPYTQDGVCIEEVIGQNEYRLPKAFGPEDVIVDIGANIGTFALACLLRGAGTVVCVEPDADNFDLLRRNLAAYGNRVRLVQAACWRADRAEQRLRLFSKGKGHTAMPFVSCIGRPIESVTLDEILREFPRVRLVKVDCEGSEYAVLTTSRELGRVEEVVGEVHPKMNLTPDLEVRTPDGLMDFLRQRGFTSTVKPHAQEPEYLSLFFARRNKPRGRVSKVRK